MDGHKVISELIEQVPDNIKKETLNSAISLMKVLFKDPLIEIGNIFTDKLKSKRYSTMINIVADAHQKLLKAGLSPSEPSLKVIMPLLESSSLEEDINLKNKWSSLLKNALDENKNADSHIAYINILKELTSKEGLVLDFLFKSFDGNRFDVYHASYLLEEELGIESDVFYIYLDNFQRMKLVESTLDREIYSYLQDSKYEVYQYREEYSNNVEIKNSREFNVENTQMVFTYLCNGFMKACAS
jgi:hypothetical protein